VRITFVVHQFPPRYFTGTEQYALAVGRELQRRGHDVDVFALDPAFGEATGPWRESREVVQGLPVRRVNFWMMLGPDWARLEYRHPLMAEKFAAHLRERDPDVVHCFHLRHVGGDLIDRAVEQECPVVVSLTDFWFLCPRVILMRSDGSACEGPPEGGRGCLPCHAPELAQQLREHPAGSEIERLAAATHGGSKAGWDLLSKVATHYERWPYLRRRLMAADAVIAPTRFLRDVFVHNGVREDRIVHRGYGIDAAGLVPAAGRPERPLTFGFLGTYAPHKAPHVLVEAMLRVRGECRVILRGRETDFPDYAGPLLEKARADRRIAVSPAYERAELASVLAGLDVLVVPSTWHENSPFVVLEARAAGLPVLASRFGGLVEVVRHEVDGELFPPGDAEALARAMQRLIDEPQRLARYRAATLPPKSLATAVDEFEEIYRGASR
jgi:glycosyltransferase involved in cell wall biosynthesis